MRNTPFWWILICIMVLLDIYCFQALKVVTHSAGARTRNIIFATYWIVSGAAVVMLIILPYLRFEHQSKIFRATIFAVIVGLFMAKVVASLFFFIDDIRRGVQWIAARFSTTTKQGTPAESGEDISRSVFLSWTGMIVGSGLFGSLLYGFGNKYRYHLKRIPLHFAKLPASFKGL